jgi:large exoprotein involved in heme utilization and adhesion
LSAGKAGDITFKADSILISQSGVITNSFGAGNGGQININADTFDIQQSGVNANVFSAGKSGDITIKVDKLLLNVGGIGSTVISGGGGDAGKVNITGNTVEITNGGVSSSTQENSTGNAGEVIFNIANQMIVSYAGISANSDGIGNGGKISINANKLQIENAGIVSNTTNTGKAGEIEIVTDSFSIKSASISNTSSGTVNGGKITIKANSFNIQQGGGINSATNSIGNAGDINIDVKDLFSIQKDAGVINAGSSGAGNGGIINISAGNFYIKETAGIISETQNTGTGGDININVKDLFDIQDSAVKASSSGTGNGGRININAGDFNIASGGVISETQSTGKSGDININVKDLFDLQLGGGISAIASGTGGSPRINISTGNFQIDGGAISSQTQSIEKGGDININVKDSFILSKGNIYATSSGTGGGSRIDISAGGTFEIANSGVITETQGTGKGGDIKIDVKELVLKEPGINPDSLTTRIIASTLGNGNAGNIELFADQIVLDGIVAISSNVGSNAAPRFKIEFDKRGIPTIKVEPRQQINPNAIGDTGKITIDAKSVSVRNGAQLTTSNFGKGNAGNIRITALDAIFDGKNSTNTSGVSSSIAEGAVGNGGTIEITTNNLTLTNGAQLTTSNLNQGNAGNIIIKAANKFLIDGVIGQTSSTGVFAESQTANGGNIALTADLLVLRRGGLISTISKVEGAGGIDGNIDINTKLLVAVPKENSDIIAIGTGRSPGSNIQVRSQGIFGTQIRNEQTSESDIVATGQATLNILDTDPNNGLVTFPIDIVDSSRLINQNFCAVRRSNSSFKVTGRGGLPLSPDEPLRGHAIITPWVTLAQGNEQTRDFKEEVTKQPTPEAIVEAQGWVINDKGEVTLVAAVPTGTPQDLRKIPSGCQPDS